MSDFDEILGYEGHPLVDSTGVEFGEIEAICTDEGGKELSWARVLLGAGGDEHTFVPLTGASLAGGDVRIAFRKDQVVDALGAQLSELPTHYRVEGLPPRWP